MKSKQITEQNLANAFQGERTYQLYWKKAAELQGLHPYPTPSLVDRHTQVRDQGDQRIVGINTKGRGHKVHSSLTQY